MALEGIKVSDLAMESYPLIEYILEYWGKINVK